jgi:hypothetical protein
VTDDSDPSEEPDDSKRDGSDTEGEADSEERVGADAPKDETTRRESDASDTTANPRVPPETRRARSEQSDARAWAEPDHDSGDDGVLDPEDLDISEREEVKSHGDGQYVISTGRTSIDPEVPEVRVRGDRNDGRGDSGERSGDFDGDPLEAVEADLRALSSQYALSVVARDGAESGSLQVASADRAATLESVLQWYAKRVDPDADPETTIRRVLAETDLDLGIDSE